MSNWFLIPLKGNKILLFWKISLLFQVFYIFYNETFEQKDFYVKNDVSDFIIGDKGNIWKKLKLSPHIYDDKHFEFNVKL